MIRPLLVSLLASGCMVGDEPPPDPPATRPHVTGGPFQLGDAIAAAPGQDWADPGIVFANGLVYRYSTSSGAGWVPVTSSASLTGPWSAPHDALPGPPGWVLGHVWAPEVVALDGAYYLYYAAKVRDDGSAFGEHAIGVAVASTPDGPFTPVGDGPLVRDVYGRGVIDPDVEEIAGRRWLVWSTDFGPAGRGSGIPRTIVAQELVTPTQVAGTIWLLLEAGAPWENGTTEAPAMVMDVSGVPHLFYSGANFDDPSYGIGLARCPAFPTSPCDRLTPYGPILRGGGLDIVPAFFGAIGIFHDGPVGDREDRFIPITSS